MQNLLNIFAIMPGLVKQDKKKQENKLDDKIEQEKSDDLVKLFALKREYLVADSKIIQQDIHRKMFNDSVVNFLKNQVNIFN